MCQATLAKGVYRHCLVQPPVPSLSGEQSFLGTGEDRPREGDGDVGYAEHHGNQS